MNRIDKLFAEKGRDILSVYYPAGFPNLDDTSVILRELEAQGVDMVELGVPFSDPMADGVVIQQASTKALENGMSLKKLFSQIEDMRADISIPVLLMGYLNPIMHYGFEAFCEDCKRVGIDGMIIPDLPFKEYMADFKAIAEKYELKVVMFISPETSVERIHLIDTHASGFIYMVSSAGTTGARGSLAGSGDGYFERVDALGLKHPRLIGFGVSNKETFDAASSASSGAIIGSHFVKLLESCESPKSAVAKLLNDIGR
ncbi:MAG: tryptophan synthase subunit alpha [Rikenellaceae bacterium]